MASKSCVNNVDLRVYANLLSFELIPIQITNWLVSMPSGN